MTKRAFGKFPRRKQDAYDTPPEAVKPLLEHLPKSIRFLEPCAGNGQLVVAMEGAGHVCAQATDTRPRHRRVGRHDALQRLFVGARDWIVTNPPWAREVLHPMILHFSALAPTWLLFDADWMHTKQAAPYRYLCQKVVSVGRVSWMQNGTGGLDNCAWYLFDKNHQGQTAFHWRAAA